MVLFLRQPDVDAIVAGEGLREHALDFVGMTGHLNRPAWQRSEQCDVLGCLVRASGMRRVVRRPVAHQHRTDVLVAEVELDLLERPLDDERRIRVDDRTVTLECEPRRNADHQLLADADVVQPRMPRHLCDADLREHHGHARVRLQSVGCESVEPLAHRHLRTSATTTCGRSSCDTVSARSSSSWSRPSARATLHSSSSKRAPMPPGQ